MEGTTALELRDVSVGYGPVVAVRGLSLRVERNEAVALLGHNGAGKTSTLHAVMGSGRLTSGTVALEGTAITRWPTERIVRAGLTMVPEGRQVFATLSVRENLLLGAACPRTRGRSQQLYGEMLELFPTLGERSSQVAGSLSGGEQQQLAIARALMSDPSVLLLDEPSLGLAPKMVDIVFDLIRRLRTRNLAILVVEQNVELALDVADRAYVLSTGELRAEGPAEELRGRTHSDYLSVGVEA